MLPGIIAIPRTPGVANDKYNSRFRWTGWGEGQAVRCNAGQKNNLWTAYGQDDGSERICETLHLSDALGHKQVKPA